MWSPRQNMGTEQKPTSNVVVDFQTKYEVPIKIAVLIMALTDINFTGFDSFSMSM